MSIEIKTLDGEALHTVDADSLSGANLRGADLSGADLGGANLIWAKVTQSQMPDIIKALRMEVMP